MIGIYQLSRSYNSIWIHLIRGDNFITIPLNQQHLFYSRERILELELSADSELECLCLDRCLIRDDELVSILGYLLLWWQSGGDFPFDYVDTESLKEVVELLVFSVLPYTCEIDLGHGCLIEIELDGLIR